MSDKILIVDDSGLARRRARGILEEAGYEVVEAEDGMAALERYFVDRPDLVLLDLVMKGMYGLDVLAKLREMDGRRAGHRRVRRRAVLVARNGRAGGRRRFPRQADRRRRARWPLVRSTLGDARVKLKKVQQDALVELLNIGFGRAGASLSKLTGQRVLLEVPSRRHPSRRPARRVARARSARTNVASVHQVFSGPVAGDALLILDPHRGRRR